MKYHRTFIFNKAPLLLYHYWEIVCRPILCIIMHILYDKTTTYVHLWQVRLAIISWNSMAVTFEKNLVQSYFFPIYYPWCTSTPQVYDEEERRNVIMVIRPVVHWGVDFVPFHPAYSPPASCSRGSGGFARFRQLSHHRGTSRREHCRALRTSHSCATRLSPSNARVNVCVFNVARSASCGMFCRRFGFRGNSD